VDEFVVRAAVAGLGVALIAGPLGCFVVWRRMSYFGATLSHSALLGIALGLVFNIHVYAGILIVCVAVSLLLASLRMQRRLATDTVLGILAHAALALGLVVLALLPSVRVDLLGYLFGDLLAVRWRDIYFIYAGGALAAGLLFWLWRPLLALTVHEDLARVEGLPVATADLAFMVLLSIVIAAAMQIVGLLLIVSMLILPAATARRFAASPEQMAALSVVFGALSIIAGLAASLRLDTPAGPSVVLAASLLFAAMFVIPARN